MGSDTLDHLDTVGSAIDVMNESAKRCKKKTSRAASMASSVTNKLAKIKKHIANNGNGALKKSNI